MPAPPSAARAALERTVVALTGAIGTTSVASDGAERWPAYVEPSRTPESRERLALTGERHIWMAEDAHRAALARDITALTRALRDDGMTSRQAVVMVADVVREAAAPSLGGGPLGALLHDVGRCCVEAYFDA
jgi:hypothetical protein